MINRACLCVGLILSFLYSKPYSWEKSPVEPIVQRGVNALYNYQFEPAISILDSAHTLDPLHPLPPFVLIAAKWLQSQTTEGYAASYEVIIKETAAVIPVYEALLENYPDDAEYHLYLGSTYGIRSRIALAKKDWLDVLYFGYQGLQYINEAHRIDPTLDDIYMPLGTLTYSTCISPLPVQWAAQLMGLSSDCEEGLSYLERAVQHSHYSWIEASNVLAYIYLHIDRDYQEADRILNTLFHNFPGHPYFAFLYGELLAKTNQWAALEKIMPKLENHASTGPFLQHNECQLKLKYIQGLMAYHHQNYTAAIKHCNWMLNNYHMEFDWLRGFAYFLRGKAYEGNGNFHLALRDYNDVLSMDSYYPEVEEANQRIRLIHGNN